MSRHRSPGGRRWVAVASANASAPRSHRTPRHRATAVRHGMGAAVVGGAIAALAPTLLVAGQAADAATALRLAADDDHDVEGPGPAIDTGHRLVTAIPRPSAPVAHPEQPKATVDDLIKAAGLEDVARQADALEALRKAVAGCPVRLPTLGPVKTWVGTAARFIACLYDERDILGVGGRGRHSDHPVGLAVDFMTTGTKGDRIARCVLDNREELGVTYVIWKQRINYGEGWEPMEDRGSVTENHFDHVHVSFEKSAPDGVPDPTRCS